MSLALRSALLTDHGFRHGFSLRHGGASTGPYASLNLGDKVGDDPRAVAENHARFAADVGYAGESLYLVSQVHGDLVEEVDPAVTPSDFRLREADALVSRHAGHAIGVRVADCVPVLVADPETGAVAAIHAGWRGVVACVIEQALSVLSPRAGRAGLVAAIFPCIGVEAFEVGDDVAAQVAHAAGDDRVVHVRAPRPHVDLALAVRCQLVALGLADARVETVLGCTFSEPARFFSHRRDQGLTGRHLAVIVPRC